MALKLGGRTLTVFSYGFVQEKEIWAPSNIEVGEVFLRKLEAVCVKTRDGAVWIKMLRQLKSKQNPYPFKVPATLQLGEEALSGITRVECKAL